MPGRIPISFYLNILAGIVVLFNHYATSETGDVALNKVTGAAGRFYDVFQDSALAFRNGFYSHLETALCGPAMSTIFPEDAAEYIRLHYCHGPSQESGSVSTGAAPSDRRPHDGYGGSDIAFVYHRPPVRALEPRSSEHPLFGSLPLALDRLKQRLFAEELWKRSFEVVEVTGALFFRVYASWWWFRAPVTVTSAFLAVHTVMSAIGYLFKPHEIVKWISQVYMIVIIDFLRCVEWEAQRHTLDIAVSVMEGVYGTVVAHS